MGMSFWWRLGASGLLMANVACSGADEVDLQGPFPAATADAGARSDASPTAVATDAGPPVNDAATTDAAKEPWDCVNTAHIGDSLTAYTVPALTAEYTKVGVTDLVVSAGGGRAILQKISPDKENGKAAATRIRSEGFTGCWVVALGTNDTANIEAGASYSRASAIDQMMTAIDENKQAKVLWVNTFTTRTSGYYDSDNMILWNNALTAAKARWPNLRVFDWAAIAGKGTAPFADGIHHTTAGYAVRNKAITEALVTFFPK